MPSQKSLLIPAAHDEPHFHFTAYQPIFHLPQGIIYNTDEERRLVHNKWHNENVPYCVAGIGVKESQSEIQYTSEDDSAAYLEFIPANSLYLLT